MREEAHGIVVALCGAGERISRRGREERGEWMGEVAVFGEDLGLGRPGGSPTLGSMLGAKLDERGE